MGQLQKIDDIVPLDITAAARLLFAEGAAFAASSEPAMIVGRDGRVAVANRAAGWLVGWVQSEPSLPAALGETFETGVQQRWETGIGADGVEKIVEITVRPLGGTACLLTACDLTAERSLRNALVESRRRYKDLVEICSDFAWETGEDGRFVFVSPRGALGYEADELIGRGADTLLAAPSPDRESPFRARSPVVDADLWLTRADGSTAAVVVSALPVASEDGPPRGVRGICRDVSSVWRRDAALARAQTRERLLAYVIRAMRDEPEPQATLAAAARAVARAFGAAACEILRNAPDTGFVPAASYGPDDRAGGAGSLLTRAAEASGERACVADDGRTLCVATAIGRRVNGALVLRREPAAAPFAKDDLSLALDVAVQIALAIEQIDSRTRLEALSRTDELTGLLNRRAFREEVAVRIGRQTPIGASATLFYVDLDNFKLVNDSFGHDRGDSALIDLADLLRRHTRPGDLIARFGGDEFALWLDRTDAGAAVEKAGTLIEATRRLAPYTGDPARPLGISIGIAVHRPSRGESLAELTARADAAMYRVKHGAKGGFVVAPDAPLPEAQVS